MHEQCSFDILNDVHGQSVSRYFSVCPGAVCGNGLNTAPPPRKPSGKHIPEPARAERARACLYRNARSLS
ncbi:hypothetical protein Ga0080574_TMP2645 [Salipiger abyssi]|uniref:Uncharacterized protein n=1 Tax=Salipiger abyssi TaxID=1250539 RepID=A0A1P8UUA7_9RHOB|nr:hypothetical protein Ga0080574_TMP2645 [Salipiger abyssi]